MTEPSISELGLITLKHGPSYAIFDQLGDIAPETGLPGFYFNDMRHISELRLLVGGQKPRAGGAQVSADNAELVVSLTLPEMKDAAGANIPANNVHIKRRITVCDGLVHQAVTIRNYGGTSVSLPLSFRFGSDFVDMFNVRGQDGKKTLGTKDPALLDAQHSRVSWRYAGVDQKELKANVFFADNDRPAVMTETGADFDISLPPGGEKTIWLECGCDKGNAAGPREKSYNDALAAVRAERAATLAQGAQLMFSNPQLQDWFDRSLQDLAFLTTQYDSGPYPCAGVPWFAVPFGRDGLITALEMLWAKPELAKGVLQFLSDRQAQTEDPVRDTEPGKIMHETREDEMSRAGMLPFSLYYGGTDTTLLYVMLAGAYLEQTGDVAFIKSIWPNIQAALDWVENYAEDKNWMDKDKAKGFIVYQRKKESGLYNQMWKDSSDSVFDENGKTDVAFPRAVAEVQGYAYAAWKTGKKLADIFHDAAHAAHYAEKAKRLYRNFNKHFWNKDEKYYILARDGNGKPCAVKASNMGQLLFTGIVPKTREKNVSTHMMGEKFFSGYGIRTVATDAPRYNPLSYHNGSVWPHDTALIAAGLGQTGHTKQAARLFEGLFAAAKKSNWRMPELFGGFKRTPQFGPTPYPQACSPQAWAAAVPFQLLQAVLGLETDARSDTVKIDTRYWRPEWGTVTISRLPVGDKTADLEISAGQARVLKGSGIKIVTCGKSKTPVRRKNKTKRQKPQN